jgi:hypothetical protein
MKAAIAGTPDGIRHHECDRRFERRLGRRNPVLGEVPEGAAEAPFGE